MLTPRLECILNHIGCGKIADIGTDHAYIPIILAQNSCVSHIIATDVKIGPINIALANIEKHKLESTIEVRLGNGLAPILPNEVDEIIIAGMGGILISQILSEGEIVAKSAKKLILQPMNYQYDLRKFLFENGYTIVNEDLVVEGIKVYNVFEVQKGQCEGFDTDFEYHVPTCILNHPNIKNLLDKKQREFSRILIGLKNASIKNDEEILKYQNLLSKIIALKEELF